MIAALKNPDILATVAGGEAPPFTVGFAAETSNVLEYARGKLERKGLNMIIANDVSNPDIGFNSDQNAVTIITQGSEKPLEQAGKDNIARQIIEHIAAAVDSSA